MAACEPRARAGRTRQREVNGEHAIRGPRFALVRHAALAQHPRDVPMQPGGCNLHEAQVSTCPLHARLQYYIITHSKLSLHCTNGLTISANIF